MIYLATIFNTSTISIFAIHPPVTRKKITNLNAALWDKLTLMPVERIPYKAC
jgi:hypothetical protein